MKPILEVHMTYSVQWAFIFLKKLFHTHRTPCYIVLENLPSMNPKVYSYIHKFLSLIHTWNKLHPLHLFTSYFCKDCFQYYPLYTQTSTMVTFFRGFWPKCCKNFSSPPIVLILGKGTRVRVWTCDDRTW